MGRVRELYRCEHFVVTLDEARRILRRQRTVAGYASIEQVDRVYATLLDAVERYHRPDYGLLVDLRLAPPRNDDAFEAVVGRYFPRLYGDFRKVASLVKMEAGRLQVLRLAAPGAAGRHGVFTDEAAATEFLLAPGHAAPPPGRGSR
jgi:hypothetical protein